MQQKLNWFEWEDAVASELPDIQIKVAETGACLADGDLANIATITEVKLVEIDHALARLKVF